MSTSREALGRGGWGRYLFCLFLIYKILSIWLLARSDFIFLSISYRSRLSKCFGRQQYVSTKSSFTTFLLTHIKGTSLLFPFSFVCLFCDITLLKYLQAFTINFLNTVSTSIPDTVGRNMADISSYHSLLVSCFLRLVITICKCVSSHKKPKIKKTID